MAAGSNTGDGRRARQRVRGVPGNGRPRARRVAAGTLGAALIGAGPTGFVVASPPAYASTGASTPATTVAQGYRLVGGDGGVFNFKTNFYGTMAGQSLAAPVVGGASMPDGSGYWLVGSDGGVFAFGRAGFYGSLWGIKLNAPIVGLAPTADGKGYWLVGKDGGIFAFGDAVFEGSLANIRLGGPAVGIAGDTVDDAGYWVVGADGGVFALGHARFHGSATKEPLRGPLTGITAAPGGGGYWLSGVDGGVFSYGVPFYGSRGTSPAPFDTVGIQSTPSGHGYWLATSDGRVYPFGDALDLGSLSGRHLAAPIVGITGQAGGPAFTASYPRPLWVGVSTDASQGGVGGDDTPTFSKGNAPYKAVLAAGTHLPPGLLLESDGTLRGDPAAPAEFTVVFTDAKGNQTSVPVSVGYAPTGYIAALAGGPVASTATSGSSSNSSGVTYGQTHLPSPDSGTVAQGKGTVYPSPDEDADTGGSDGDGGASTGSQAWNPDGVAVAQDGTVYLSETDFFNGSPAVIRDITPDGIVHDFAGDGSTQPASGGTKLSDVAFNQPQFLGVDRAGDIFVGDTGNKQIYFIPAKSGDYYGGTTPYSAGYAYAVGATIGQLNGMAVTPDGTLYWSDGSSQQVEMMGLTDTSPSIAVPAAAPGADAGSAALGTPTVLAVDPADGTLYLANRCSTCNTEVIDEVSNPGPDANLTDIAQGGQWDISGLTVDDSHNVYASDDFGTAGTGAKTYDNLILRVSPGAGTVQSKVQVIAGRVPTLSATASSPPLVSYDSTYQNGVPATQSGIDTPWGVAYDPAVKTLVIGQAAWPGTGGVAAKAVRVVSNPAQAPGTTYTPGPTQPNPTIG